ncbi:MAG: hypothetical protein AB7O56_11300 [Bauldia sp.]
MNQPKDIADLPPRQTSLRRGMIVILVVLALLAVIFPQGVANWLDEKCFGNRACDTIGDGFRAIERGWDAIGVSAARDGAGEWLRGVLQIPES